MELGEILQTVTIGSAVLMIIMILLQQRGASLGAGLGGSGELYTTRRGVDKSLFDISVILAIIFVASIVVVLILPVK